MKKKIYTLLIFIMVLICLTFNLSYAWYTLKEDCGIIQDLNSIGIKISLNTSLDNNLEADVLKKGVLDESFTLPSDYYDKKSVNDFSYVESFGNIVSIKENIELYLIDEGVSISFLLKYLDEDNCEVLLTNEEMENYYNITYDFVDSDNVNVSKDELVSGNYIMTINLSYKVPDELLPLKLINSSKIWLVVTIDLV